MFSISIDSFLLFRLTILLLSHCHYLTGSNDDNYRWEILSRPENTSIRFVCDLVDVAWWKRPDLLVTRSGTIIERFRSQMFIERSEQNIQSHILRIQQLQSNDSGVYECETLGAIRLYNLTVTGKDTEFEFVHSCVSIFSIVIF
jgi:hypothetical protein